jgi:hypothetical protein
MGKKHKKHKKSNNKNYYINSKKDNKYKNYSVSSQEVQSLAISVFGSLYFTTSDD